MHPRTDELRAATDRALMQRALDAAVEGVEADPNPRVGCVIVNATGEVVATGWHRGAGTPHGEVDALGRAGDRARGGTAYVTLEPCAHTGRTGPCAQALLDAGIAEVVYAVADPNPTAAGGAAWLAERGVAVRRGVLESQGRELLGSWLHLQETGRPWVVWKFAATLDGRSAAADGSSRWITGEAARADVHRLRARCGAIVVGTGTVLTDQPRLTVRNDVGEPAARQPLRVVVGRRRTPLLEGEQGGWPVLRLPGHDPRTVVNALSERGIHRVWLEGGPTLAAAWLRAQVVDEVVSYLAPALLGAGAAAVPDLGIGSMESILRLRPSDVQQLDPDVRITATPLYCKEIP